ncbi:peptidoglycan DD-metalloendopeptidase family protein [Snodgrassella sp. ESL0324]|nr:peptidoglycan DD-metalloendopeptidase family protein [Snodgrassella sp. ESL0324]
MNGRAQNGYYRVQRGDTLYRIGLRFNQDVNTLVRWNHLANPHAIEVGQLIRVRKPDSVSGGSARVKRQPGRVTPKPDIGTTTTAAPDIRLRWPVQGKVISTFNGQTQKGIDIAGSRGTPVKAAAAGIVEYAGEELRGYGKLVLIKHSNSTMTAYAYNDSLKVVNGQKVQAGQTIAAMGDSGTTGVKLHFEVRVNSKAVNPLRYLSN